MANFREGVKTPTKFSKWGTFTGPQHLEGVAGKEGGEFFQGGGAVFTYKINQNLKYLMMKKVMNKNIFLSSIRVQTGKF